MLLGAVIFALKKKKKRANGLSLMYRSGFRSREIELRAGWLRASGRGRPDGHALVGRIKLYSLSLA